MDVIFLGHASTNGCRTLYFFPYLHREGVIPRYVDAPSGAGRIKLLQSLPAAEVYVVQRLVLGEAELEVLSANVELAKRAKIYASREAMESEVRRIQDTIRAAAVVAPPVPVFVLGVVIFVRRRRREREGAAAVRRLRGAA